MLRRLTFLMALVTFVGISGPAWADKSNGSSTESKAKIEYTVEPGDTLGSIALRFNVGVAEMKAWNNLDSVDVRPGDRLVVNAEKATTPQKPLPIVHVVRRGDTFEGIAKKYGVSTKKILSWNKKLNPRRLPLGAEIKLHIPGRKGRSVSWGTPNRGKLYNAVQLTGIDGLRVRKEHRAYGTRRTAMMLQAAAADVVARWPDAPALIVGDVSFRRGGRMRPHKSHQSGRDADVSYYHRGNVETRDFEAMRADTFDAVKNWHYFKTLVDTEQVEYIFVDYRLQKILYDYARSIGYTQQDLAPILQYPRSRGERQGVIRHARGHDDHFHIRFKCGPNDKHCR